MTTRAPLRSMERARRTRVGGSRPRFPGRDAASAATAPASTPETRRLRRWRCVSAVTGAPLAENALHPLDTELHVSGDAAGRLVMAARPARVCLTLVATNAPLRAHPCNVRDRSVTQFLLGLAQITDERPTFQLPAILLFSSAASGNSPTA